MTKSSEIAYDDLPFESRPGPERHPDRLALVGKLFGMQPPVLETMTVLELGCSSGANLIPIALMYPKARLVGIDLSSAQIAAATKHVKELGIENIEFLCGDITAEIPVPASDRFDFIICHGVYSWVLDPVRQAVLKCCRDRLSESGIAYISYNLLPGWATRGEIRDQLLVEDKPSDARESRIAAARKVMEDWEFRLRPDLSKEAVRIKEELRKCVQQSDSFILHELLSPSLRPFFLNEFVAQVEDNELQYLGDGLPQRMWFDPSPDGGAERLRLDGEQELDHSRALTFRGSLLCRKEIALHQTPDSTIVQTSFITSGLVPRAERPDIHSDASLEFVTVEGIARRVKEPLCKAALIYLRGLWPVPVKYSELFDAARELASFDEPTEEEQALLVRLLLEEFFAGNVFLELHAGFCVNRIPEFPCVSRFARLQGRENHWVTNLRHEFVTLEVFERQLLQFLDGSRDFDSLCKEMLAVVTTSNWAAQEDGSPVTDESRMGELVSESVRSALERGVEHALFLNASGKEREASGLK